MAVHNRATCMRSRLSMPCCFLYQTSWSALNRDTHLPFTSYRCLRQHAHFLGAPAFHSTSCRDGNLIYARNLMESIQCDCKL